MTKTGFDRFNPFITVRNESTLVKDKEVRRVLPALQKQISAHFAPAWGLHARLVFGQGPPRAMKVILRDVSDEKGDLGYHFMNGYPVTYVFAKDDLEQYGEFTSTLSHELLEMLADPDANLYAMGFTRAKSGKKSQAWIPYEVCGAVQENLYSIDGVRVSDFLLPEWFEPEHTRGSMKMDYRGVLRSPFDIAPGGYTDAMVDGKWKTMWGRKARRDKVRHRQLIRAARSSGRIAGRG
jgi:hypothetical protein